METNKDIQELSDEQIIAIKNSVGDRYNSVWNLTDISACAFARAILATRQPAPVASTPAVAVPEGYALVPRKMTDRQAEETVYNINRKYKVSGPLSDFLVRQIWEWAIYAAPQPSAAPVAADVARGDGKPHEIVHSIIGGIREFYLGMLSSSVRNDCADVFDRARSADATYVAYRAVQDRFAALLAAKPPADAAPAWDADATKRLRSIVDLMGLQSDMPEDDLTGYEFAVLGLVRAEIKLLKAKADAAPGDAKSESAEAGDTTFDGIFTQRLNEHQATIYNALKAAGRSMLPLTKAAQPSPAQGEALSLLEGEDIGCMREQATAWHAVHVALTEVCPGWHDSEVPTTGIERAVTAIKALAQRAASQPEAAGLELKLPPTSEMATAGYLDAKEKLMKLIDTVDKDIVHEVIERTVSLLECLQDDNSLVNSATNYRPAGAYHIEDSKPLIGARIKRLSEMVGLKPSDNADWHYKYAFYALGRIILKLSAMAAQQGEKGGSNG